MTYAELYPLSEAMKYQVILYTTEQGCVDDKYHIAMMFLDQLREKSFKNESIRTVFYCWLSKGGTNWLKNALKHTTYDENIITHFNAMALLDSVRCRNYINL